MRRTFEVGSQVVASAAVFALGLPGVVRAAEPATAEAPTTEAPSLEEGSTEQAPAPGEPDLASQPAADAPAPDPVAELPPLDPHEQEDYVEPRDPPPTPSRLVEIGGLFGSVIRPSGNAAIQYRTGYFFGASVRAELASWMGLRISYREEHVPVQVDAAGFDFGQHEYGFDFVQPDLEIITIGARLEPTYVAHPRFRVFGVLGIGWVRLDAPMPTAPGFLLPGKRSATEVNIPLGVGVSFELIPDWVNTTLSFTYGFAFDQHGGAYEPLQAIVDGRIVYLAPLPNLQSVGDLIFTVGVIL